MRRDIAESTDDIDEESTEHKRSLGRAREQASTLSTLGLSEREAVEYVLMLSRDEHFHEEQAGMESLSAAGGEPGPSFEVETEEGVFDVDMDEVSSDGANSGRRAQGNVSAPSPPQVASSPSSPIRPVTRPIAGTPSSVTSSYGRQLPRAMPSWSNSKVQVSPRFQSEPMEAGGLSPTPMSLDGSLPSSPAVPVPVPRAQDFPNMSAPGSASSTGIFTPTRLSSASSISGGAGRSVDVRNAWSTPLTSRTNSANGTPGSSPAVSRTSSVAGSLPQQSGISWARRLSLSPIVSPVSGPASRPAGLGADADVRAIEEEEDEELRFVLELSLAEERSRMAAAAGAGGSPMSGDVE